MATNPVKSRYTFTQKDFYKNYKKKSNNPVTWKQYTGFISDFFAEMLRQVIYDRTDFRFPINLGYITLTSRKIPIKHRHINMPHLKKTGEKKRILSLETDGRFYSLKWRTFRCNLKNKSLYLLKTPQTSWTRKNAKTSIKEYINTTLTTNQKLLP
jgi:hypothetical protein